MRVGVVGTYQRVTTSCEQEWLETYQRVTTTC
jgi:hypothetical protein